jgi:hypothetical protein
MIFNLVYYLFGWVDDEIQADEKSKYQKYLVCKQIRESQVRLKTTPKST